MTLYLLIVAGTVLHIALACMVGIRLRSRTVSPVGLGDALVPYAMEEVNVVVWREEEPAKVSPAWQAEAQPLQPAASA